LNTSRVVQAINRQINAEIYSGYLYLAMAAYFESASLPGFAGWMKLQAQEELQHAMRLFDHLADVGAPMAFDAIAKPDTEFTSPVHVFEKTLAHEQEVTRNIHDLYALAVAESDYPAQVMLQWFVAEQVEEEKTAAEILDTLRRIGDKSHALVALDRELGRRGA